jgi:hypothetical protein
MSLPPLFSESLCKNGITSSWNLWEFLMKSSGPVAVLVRRFLITNAISLMTGPFRLAISSCAKFDYLYPSWNLSTLSLLLNSC